MRTNIELDENLVKQAMDLTKITTKKALVHKALEELVRANIRKEILKYKNTGIWEGDLSEMRALR